MHFSIFFLSFEFSFSSFLIFIHDALFLYKFTYLFVFFLAVDNNEIRDNVNNNINKNEIKYEHYDDYENLQINDNPMICVNGQKQFVSSSYSTKNAERTTSSSSSEQLIPKEKQTGTEQKSE